MLFFVRNCFCSGPVAGLLGRPASFREVLFSVRLLLCFVFGCVAAVFVFAQLDFVQGLSLPCLVAQLDFFRGLSLACLFGLLLFVK